MAGPPSSRPSSAAPSKQNGTRERVQVIVRCRPLSDKEVSNGHHSCVKIDKTQKTVEVFGTGKRGAIDSGSKIFTFDNVYDGLCTQKELYDEVAHPIVHSVMHGYNGTVLAYGQTASGKTFTMEGLENPPGMRGIIPKAFEDIFTHIVQSQSSDHFLVRASYLEIYNEEIRDLLVPNTSANMKLELKESPDAGVFVKNLTALTVHSLADISHLLTVGRKNRSMGATLMNQDSSRSHSIFTITVESSAMSTESENNLHVRVGKLNLVDLAGSERMSKTGATGDRFKELTNINWSLSALGNVISALADGRSTHIPYRDSKLTRILQDSLGGNTRTVMIANIGPANYDYDESISTLRYANRTKSIRNRPRVNEDPKDALLREFEAEISRLKAQLKTSGPTVEELAKEIYTLKSEKESVEKHLLQVKEQASKQQELDPTLCRSWGEQAISYIKADLERKAHLEIELLRAEKERSEEEKQKFTDKLLEQLKEMQHHYEALAREKEDRQILEKKLKALEEKLLHGCNNDRSTLFEKAKQQERELAIYAQELQEKKCLDEERQRKIAELEEAQLMAEEKCTTMEEELEMKTKKLKKLMACYQQSKTENISLRTELQDTVHEFQQERADLLLTLRSLDQQHQLKTIIIERFIPTEEVSKIMRRVQWDDENETWVLPSTLSQVPSQSVTSSSDLYIIDPFNKQPLQRPASAVGRSRPTSQQAIESLEQGKHDPRFMDENVLKLDLEFTKSRLYDYENRFDRAEAQDDIMQAFPYLSYESNGRTSDYTTSPKLRRIKTQNRRPRTATG